MSDRISSADYRRRVNTDRKRSKYRNVKTSGYDSAKEASRADDLFLMEQAGEISDLREQVPMALTVDGILVGTIVVDFVYRRGKKRVYEDVKSDPTETDLFKWKAKHFKAQYGQSIEVWK